MGNNVLATVKQLKYNRMNFKNLIGFINQFMNQAGSCIASMGAPMGYRKGF